MHEHPSVVTLAQYADAQLTEEQRSALEEHLQGCEGCQLSVARARQDVQAYAKVEHRARARLRATLAVSPRRILVWAIAVSAVAALLVFLPRQATDEPGRTLPVEAPPVVRAKGGAELLVTRFRAQAAAPLTSDNRVQGGDRLQFTATAEDSGWVTVVVVDQAGQASTITAEPTRVVAGTPLPLEQALVLDEAAAGFELVVACWSVEPVPPATLAQAVGAAVRAQATDDAVRRAAQDATGAGTVTVRRLTRESR